MDFWDQHFEQNNCRFWHFCNLKFDSFWKHLFIKEVKAKRWQKCGCTFLSETLFYFSIYLILEFIQNGFREIRISIQMFICKCISFFRNLLILNWKRCESYFKKKKCKIKKQFLKIFNLVYVNHKCKVEIQKMERLYSKHCMCM